MKEIKQTETTKMKAGINTSINPCFPVKIFSKHNPFNIHSEVKSANIAHINEFL